MSSATPDSDSGTPLPEPVDGSADRTPDPQAADRNPERADGTTGRSPDRAQSSTDRGPDRADGTTARANGAKALRIDRDPRTTDAAPPHRQRRRDRRGRGMRGQLLPRGVPAWRSRADRFDDLVLDAVEHLEHRWGRELEGVEFAVEDVPPSDPSPWEHGEVPLGRFFPAEGELPPRIVVYRRPVETRAGEAHEVGSLAQNVVVEQVAHLLGLPPDQIDPRYGLDD